MRVLMVEPGPNFSVADVYTGWRKALTQLGCDVKEVDLANRITFMEQANKLLCNGETVKQDVVRVANEGILAKAYIWAPDVILIVSAFFVAPELYPLFRARGQKVVVLLTEAPYEDPHQIEIAARADVALVNDPTNLDAYREVQPNTFYLPHAYDPDIHHPRQPRPDLVSDMFWCGTAYPSRIEWFESVDWDGIDVKLGGNWQNLSDDSPLNKFLVADDKEWCLDNTDAVEFYTSTRASVNTYRKEAATDHYSQGWAMGPREVELAACGTFYLTEARPENRSVLPMVPTFDGPEDFGEKLRWWLAHPEAAQEVADAARAAIADRTFISHARFLLDVLTKQGAKHG